MSLGSEDTISRPNSIDEGLKGLRHDWLDLPGGAADQADQADVEVDVGTHERSPRDLGMFELEVERVHKRLLISDILVRYVRDGARTLSEVQQAMSAQDLDEIMAICKGAPVRDVLWTG